MFIESLVEYRLNAMKGFRWDSISNPSSNLILEARYTNLDGPCDYDFKD